MLLSHLAVALVGSGTAVLIVVWQAPAVFNRGMHGPGMGNGAGAGMGQGQTYRALFVTALRTALVWGSLAALVVALGAAWFIAVRLSRPLEHVREATQRISGGDYDLEIPAPRGQELADLVGDVNAMAHRLRDVEGERVRLLGEVAHEMRTPLTVLTGRVEGLQDGVFTVDQELLQGLADELRRLQRLADDLATLSRVEERRLVLERAPLDLVGLVAKTVDRFRADPRAAGVELVATGARTAVVEGDAQRLGQVLDNLLSNALRAVGGTGRIVADLEVDAHQVRLTVTDTGAGIVAADLERVFERFYRGPNARPEDGTGVGLTVSRGIAVAHGGSLTASSAGAGHGASFTLTLPRAS